MKTKRLLLIGAAALLAAACASTPLEDKKDAPITDKSTSGATTTQSDPLMDPNSPLAKRSIFFDFDSFVVKSEFQPIVETHGKFLSSNKGRRIVIEGNTDERGSREYNLALGQKRAEAVKSRLQLLGATDAQMEAVSFGEERPKATGGTEDAWAQNRRADIVYK